MLSAIGLESWTRGWLGEYAFALPAVGLVGTWFESGLVTVLLLAGMGRISRDLYEAARLDGAGPVREFFAVTLPSVRGEIAVALTLTVIAALKTFDLIYLTTAGGPGPPDHRAELRGLPAGVRARPGRAGLRDRGLPHRRHLRDQRGHHPGRRQGDRLMRVTSTERNANYVILAAFALFAIWPIVGIVVAGLQPEGDAPGGLANLEQAWQIGRFGGYLRTSVMVSAFVVSVSAVLSVLAGFALGTMRFRGADAIFYLMLVGIMMPAEAIIVPLFFDLRAVGLTDTFWAIALPQVAQSVAFGTFWMRAAFRAQPRRSSRRPGSTARRPVACCGSSSSRSRGRPS